MPDEESVIKMFLGFNYPNLVAENIFNFRLGFDEMAWAANVSESVIKNAISGLDDLTLPERMGIVRLFSTRRGHRITEGYLFKRNLDCLSFTNTDDAKKAMTVINKFEKIKARFEKPCKNPVIRSREQIVKSGIMLQAEYNLRSEFIRFACGKSGLELSQFSGPREVSLESLYIGA